VGQFRKFKNRTSGVEKEKRREGLGKLPKERARQRRGETKRRSKKKEGVDLRFSFYVQKKRESQRRGGANYESPYERKKSGTNSEKVPINQNYSIKQERDQKEWQEWENFARREEGKGKEKW